MNFSREYVVPPGTEIIFVSDMFVDDLPTGGAELTTESLIETCPYKYFKVHSASLTENLVQKNKDKYWILGNWAQVPMEATVALVQNKCRFFVIEMDFKYCVYRSPQLHTLQENGKPCNCHQEKHGRFVEALYLRAEHVFFMSQTQRQIYFDLFPTRMPACHEKFIVQSSTWSDKHLDLISDIRANRKDSHNNKFAILCGGTWIKNQTETEQYCKQNNIEYDLIGGLPYEDFLKKLSEYKGLIFRPSGWDTCPRLCVEAFLLGLELNLNDMVLHQNEPWLKDISTAESYLRTAGQRFWRNYHELSV